MKKEELNDLFNLKNKSKIFPIITNKKRIIKDIFDLAKKIKNKFILIAITADIYLTNSKVGQTSKKNFLIRAKKIKLFFAQEIVSKKNYQRQIKVERKSTLKGNI